ncbi:carbon storage regulator [Pseudomonas sp. RC4D1]|nr:carbon storage regulator [Pseudomonas sp. RC4D1]
MSTTGQAIKIDRSIKILFMFVKGDIVHLGLKAPREVHILRSELITENEKHTAPYYKHHWITNRE